MHFTSKNQSETMDIARLVGERLTGGEILALSGDLGAGKTTFTKGLADFLGINREITSPTFVIMKKYLAHHDQIQTMVHIDAYRLSSGSDAQEIGLTEILEDERNITVIEWPENILPILPADKTINIRFEYIDESTRGIVIEGIDQ